MIVRQFGWMHRVAADPSCMNWVPVFGVFNLTSYGGQNVSAGLSAKYMPGALPAEPAGLYRFGPGE